MKNIKNIIIILVIILLILIAFGIYVEVIGNKEIVTTKFFGELSGYSKELIVFGVFFLRTCISCKVEQMFTSQLT